MRVKINRLAIYYPLFLINVLLLCASCKKESVHLNEALVPEIGNWQVKSWSYSTYQNNQIHDTLAATDIGLVLLNNVAAGNVSEGKFLVQKQVNSPIFFAASSPCYETFRWQSDEHRIGFILNSCTNNDTVFTYTIDGFGTNSQTWTRIETNIDGTQKARETFNVTK
ncbi:MAG: hypothetical protein RI894_1919 [Bacteroidota bacterium]